MMSGGGGLGEGGQKVQKCDFEQTPGGSAKIMPLRVRLHVPDSAYESPYDFLNDLHTKGLFRVLIIRRTLTIIAC
jgi:hypothetical protein